VSDLDGQWPARLGDRTGLRDRLKQAYGEPHRRYHDRRHLAEVLDRVQEIAAGTPGVDRDRVLLAAWFHDAVYDPTAVDNEERSADLAEQELTGLLPDGEVAAVARLVRMTAHHQPGPDVEETVLSDADLGILAADTGRYDEYASAVRQEYAHVPDTDFRRGRARILRALLDGPSLFRTAYARARWESAARTNVERELRDLEG
jgi:predicted metal-dependent HD superfamily phosphohydrolase